MMPNRTELATGEWADYPTRAWANADMWKRRYDSLRRYSTIQAVVIAALVLALIYEVAK